MAPAIEDGRAAGCASSVQTASQHAFGRGRAESLAEMTSHSTGSEKADWRSLVPIRPRVGANSAADGADDAE
jgi:hypothetical protein